MMVALGGPGRGSEMARLSLSGAVRCRRALGGGGLVAERGAGGGVARALALRVAPPRGAARVGGGGAARVGGGGAARVGGGARGNDLRVRVP
eukprot:2672410-Rhodomonas_salina.4